MSNMDVCSVKENNKGLSIWKTVTGRLREPTFWHGFASDIAQALVQCIFHALGHVFKEYSGKYVHKLLSAPAQASPTTPSAAVSTAPTGSPTAYSPPVSVGGQMQTLSVRPNTFAAPVIRSDAPSASPYQSSPTSLEPVYPSRVNGSGFHFSR